MAEGLGAGLPGREPLAPSPIAPPARYTKKKADSTDPSIEAARTRRGPGGAPC